MSCTDREKQLPAYLGGGLSSTEMDELTDHLASCATCRKTLEDLKKTGRLVCDLEKISPPPRLKSQIMNRAREGAEKKGILRKFFFPLYIKIPVQVLAVAVISVFSFYLYRQDVPRMRTEEIPLPPSPVFETNREPPLPRVISRKRSAMPKNAVQADQEMPAASAGRSDAGDSASSVASEEKVPETGKIAADERTAENVPASAAPLPSVMPQVSGREAKDVFLSAENQKNGGMSASTPFPTEKNRICEPGAELCRYGAEDEKGERSPAKEAWMPGAEISLEWVLSVQDVRTASAELEDYAGKIDSLHAGTAVHDGKHVFTIDIRPSHVGAFREKLRTLGQVSADQEPGIVKEAPWVHIRIILVPPGWDKP